MGRDFFFLANAFNTIQRDLQSKAGLWSSSSILTRQASKGSKEILGDGLIEHVQRSIHSCFSRICGGEIRVPLLDEVGKQLLALPLRYGGQAIHDIGFEADISVFPPCTLCLATFSQTRLKPPVLTLPLTSSQTQAMVNACQRTNTLLRTSQIVGLTANPNTVLVDKSSLKWKKEVLRCALLTYYYWNKSDQVRPVRAC